MPRRPVELRCAVVQVALLHLHVHIPGMSTHRSIEEARRHRYTPGGLASSIGVLLISWKTSSDHPAYSSRRYCNSSAPEENLPLSEPGGTLRNAYLPYSEGGAIRRWLPGGEGGRQM